MLHKPYLLTFLFGFFAVFAFHSSTAQVYEPLFETCERYYDDGDYQKALEECNSIIKDLKKKSLGYKVATGEFYQAKYLEAIGDFITFEQVLGDAIKNKKTSGEKSAVYGAALLDAAQLYLVYSNTQKAEALYHSACEILAIKIADNGKFITAPEDLHIRSQAIYIAAKIHYNRGQIDKFEALVPELLAQRQRRLAGTENYFDEAQNQKIPINLSPTAQLRRKEEYAEILTLRADAQAIKGAYKQAQKYLDMADNWIKANLSVRTTSYIRNQHAQTLLMIDRGEEVSKVRTLLKENLYRAERKLTAVHKLYMQIHEAQIVDFLEQKNYFRSDFQLWELRQNARKYYGTNKLQFGVSQSLDAKQDFLQQAKSYDFIDTKLQGLYADTQKVPVNHTRRLALIEQMYEVAIAKDDYRRALTLGSELVKTHEQINGKNSLGYHYAQLNLANYYSTYTANFKKVDTLLQQSFYEGASKLIKPEHKLYVEFLNQLADFYIVTDRYDSAKNQIQRAVDITKKEYGESAVRYAVELNKLAKFQITQSNYNDAYKNIEAMLAIFEKNTNKTYNRQYAEALETAANYYVTLGLYSSAREALAKATLLNRRSNKSIANSEATDDLAFLYIKMGKYDEAEEILLEATKLRLERYGEKSRFLINPYNQLARLFLIEGEYNRASDYVEKALKLSNELFGENSMQNVESSTIVAEYNGAIGDYEKAKIEILQVIQKQQQLLGKEHIKTAASISQLGSFKFNNQESLDEIEKLFSEAEKLIAQNLGRENPIYAEALKNLALVYTENKKYADATNALLLAQNIWLKTYKTPKNLRSAEINKLLGDIETKQNRFSQATTQYNTALKVIAAKLSKQSEEYTKVLSALARMYYIAGDLNQSEKYIELALGEYKNYINKFFAAANDREKTKYWSKIRNDFEFYTNLIVRKSRTKPALLAKLYDNALLTKTLLIGSSIKVRSMILASPDSSLRKTYEKWENRKQDLTEAIALSPEQQKEENKEPKKLEKEIEDLEKTLLKNDIFKQQQEVVTTWLDIKKQLKVDEVAVEMLRYRYFDRIFTDSVVYVALAVNLESNYPKLIIIQDGNNLENKYFKFYKNSIKFAIRDLQSYNRYWKPIDEAIGFGKKIYFAAEGTYSQINPETLLVDESNYLLDKQQIVGISTTKDLIAKANVQTASKTKNNKILLIGNPAFYSDLTNADMNKVTNRRIPQLPGAQKEVQDVFKLLKEANVEVEMVLNFAASEDTLKKMINKPQILHFATHGYFASDAVASTDNALNNQKIVNTPLLNSGLLLYKAGELMASGNIYSYNKYGGVLTAYEAASLQLDGTELVILSACETARGDVKVGEGVYGLQRAIQVAGAKSLIMSLFKVSDDATQLLLSYFYINIYKKGMEKRAAFVEAKKQLRSNSRFKEPIYWGAFIMVGI
jgi:CHAT domain-containing protein/tetratricopeptide (TPR) repeat protein